MLFCGYSLTGLEVLRNISRMYDEIIAIYVRFNVLPVFTWTERKFELDLPLSIVTYS